MRRFTDNFPGPPAPGHRLVAYARSGLISVSCTCLKGSVPGRYGCPPLDSRRKWTVPEIGEVFAAHVLFGDGQ